MFIIYFILGLVAILLVLSFIMPRVYDVQKTIVIQKPIRNVADYVGDLNKYADWNPWQKTDPESSSHITGLPHSPGHKYEWKGKKVGEGSLTLKSFTDSEIKFDLQFIKPWNSMASDNWFFETIDEQSTKVTWQNHGLLPWPMGRLMGSLINKNLSKQFEEGLKSLKTAVESEP